MLVIRRNPDSAAVTRRTRDAFTLIEVLVVVAILVILASVATVGMMRYLETAKENNAKLNAQNIYKAMKAYKLSHDEWPSDLRLLVGGDGGASFIEGGEKALVDPWGNYYQFDFAQDPNTGEEIPVVYTVIAQTGKKIAWPKEYGSN